MVAALGLLAVALLGTDGSPGAGAPPVQFRVKLLEMDGLAWRESLYTKLQPVTRQGTCAVWTCGRDVAGPLVNQASRVVISPQIVSQSDAVAHFSQKATRRVASQLTRHADGPVDRAVSVAYTPQFEDVGEGCQFTVSGRRLDQGMLVKMVVDESRIAAVHQVKLTETVSAKENSEGGARISPRLDVPEVVGATLAGEWLIPNDGLLLASLGAHTINDGNGKAVVRERLLLVEANQVNGPTAVAVGRAINRAFSFTSPARAAAIPMPLPMVAPAMPSRSLPQARDADGTPVPLPPLPESKVPPSSLPGTDEPCASPQTLTRAADKDAGKTVDPQSEKARYDGDAKAAARPDSLEKVLWNLLKPYVVRFPVASGVDIEIRASISPSEKDKR